jgi:hypothetical protein
VVREPKEEEKMGDGTIQISVPEESLKALIGKEVEARLSQASADSADVKTLLETAKDEDRYRYLEQVWHNNGWVNPNDRLQYDPKVRHKHAVDFGQLVDFLTPDRSVLFFPQLITTVVREAAEPMLVLTQLLRRINFHGETITYPAIASSMTAEDIGPSMEYPEGSIDAAGIVTAKIGKSGLAFKIGEEVLRYAMFDVANLYFRASGRALARHKEQKISNMIATQTAISFDNVNPGGATHGNTSGRDSSAALNGTITLDDLFVGYADLVNQGFLPNTLLMNALGWLIFARSPELRAFGFANGGPLWQPMQGAPGQRPTFATGGVNLGPGSGTPLSGGNPQANPQASTYADVWSAFPAPLSIVVSPFIRFDETNQRTDIIMCDRNELGVIIQDEDPSSDTWNDPYRDIQYTKIRERYAIAVDNEGEAGVQFKNLKIVRGYDWEDIRTWQQGTGDLPSDTSGI